MRERKGPRGQPRALDGDTMRTASLSLSSVQQKPDLVKSTLMTDAQWSTALSRMIDQALSMEEQHRDRLLAARRIRAALEDLALGEVDGET